MEPWKGWLAIIGIAMLTCLFFNERFTARADPSPANQPVFEFTTTSERADKCDATYTGVCNCVLCYDCGEFVVPHECWCVRGDADCDGDVDLEDYRIVQREFTGPLND